MSHYDGSKNNGFKSAEGTHMSFLDWKMQKQCKSGATQKCRQEKSKDSISNNNVRSLSKPSRTFINHNNSQNTFGKKMPAPFERLPPHSNINGLKNGMNNMNDWGVGVDFSNNIFGDAINFNGNVFGSNNFNGNGFREYNCNWHQPPYRPRFQNNNGRLHFNIPNNSFQADGFCQQQDVQGMHNANCGSNNLYKGFASSKNSKTYGETSFNSYVNTVNAGQMSESKVFVRNPDRRDNRKTFIPMPKHPDLESNLNAEERKQQWREYREAMKPFKNKDFYNARRVVQRLGKKDRSELDEKQLFRLQNARQKMSEYKEKLAEKYDHYIKSTNKSANNQHGELFVLKRGKAKVGIFGDAYKPKQNHSSGRKILGGTTYNSPFRTGRI